MALKQPKGLTGEIGLVEAVLKQAVTDAMRGDPQNKAEALRYLRSDWYRAHLQLLDVPDDWLPTDQG